MTFEDEDTIVAIATPSGVGAISIIRISGKESISITNSIFKGKTSLNESVTHTIHYGNILSKTGDIIDNVLVSIFRAPNSYTGEDCVEISCHGGQLISKKIMERLLELNTRIAHPGEFTKRSYLNGKMDLIQAESVIDIIHSRNDASLKGARKQMNGFLSKRVEELKNSLLDISTMLELELDFTEEDIELVSKDELISKINKLIAEINLLLKSYSYGKIIKEGINIAIVGEPNVGKSSLLNYLLKESRAIVSDIPGTTRDIIHEDITIDGYLFKLHDTAGIRHTNDFVEIEGVQRTKKIIMQSDLIILMIDATAPNSSIIDDLYLMTERERIVTVLNKIDLNNDYFFAHDARISCVTGEGINELLALLKNKCIVNNSYTEDSAILTNSRHYTALEKAKSSLLESLNSLNENLSEEFVSVYLRNAMNCLNEIIGLVTNDEILNNIFSKFCIGK
jgi:tRNA modification GTPase